MLLLDSGQSSGQTGAAVEMADGIVSELAELQRENSALVAELRRQRRRRRVKRLRRVSFVVLPIVRAGARRFAKNPTAETPTAPTPPRPDPRVRLIILALVLRRIMVSSAEQTSSAQAAAPPRTPSEVRS